MKNKISWIYVLSYFFLIKIAGSNGLTTDAPQQDKDEVRAPVENGLKPSKVNDTDDFSREIQTVGEVMEDVKPVDPETRILRKRKSKKSKGKNKIDKKQKKKNKKKKKAKKNKKKKQKKNKNKKSNHEKKREELLEDEEISNIENDILDTDNVLAELPELDDDLDLKTNDIDIYGPLDPNDKGDVDLYHNGQKYWDSGIIEPEYIISEWFAILDGKKYDRKNGLKTPLLPGNKNQFDTDYLFNKTKNSKYLINKYSSGWKYANGDDDKMDYVTPIIVSNEALRRTYPDTKEDEVENRIINKKFSEGRNEYTGRKQYLNNRRSRTYKSRRKNRKTTGSYDPNNDYKDDPSVVLGSYRKLTDDEMENYVSEKPYGEGTPIIYNEPESLSVYDQSNNIGGLGQPDMSEDERMEQEEIRRIKEKRRREREIERDREIENDLELDQELGLNTIDDVMEVPSVVNPENINTTERLEEVKQITDDLDKRLDEELDRRPNYDLDGSIDRNFDGIPDSSIDRNFDGIPDSSLDRNFDGIPDNSIDRNFDGIPDSSIDRNFDGIPDSSIDRNFDGIPDSSIDRNFDGIPDNSLNSGNQFSEFPELYDDNDLNVNGIQNRSKRLNLNDNDIYEEKRIKKLSKRKCQKELKDLKKKYNQIVDDIKETTY